jgi:hypothetical protein
MLHAKRSILTIEGEPLSSKKVLLPRNAGNESALLIVGFPQGSPSAD